MITIATPAASRTNDYDTLAFKLHTSRTEVQETAQVRVPITALVQASNRDQAGLDGSIRRALQEFMVADWVFSSIMREGESVGYERVKLTASARVKHDEIYNLKERARAASHDGLEIGQAQVSYKLPARKVTEANQAMRLSILADALAQLPDFERLTGRTWTLAHIEFGVQHNDEGESTRFSKGGYRHTADEDVDGDSGLTGGERFSLIAEVTLRSARID